MTFNQLSVLIFFTVPDALTRGVSLFLTKTTMVMIVRTIPKEERQMGMMANTELQDIYWT